MKRLIAITLSLVALLCGLAVGEVVRAQEVRASFRWSAANLELSARKMARVLEAGSLILELRNGWSCTVGELQRSNDIESRMTICAKGSERFSFTTACTPSDSQETTRIWLGDPRLDTRDVIEISCGLNGEA